MARRRPTRVGRQLSTDRFQALRSVHLESAVGRSPTWQALGMQAVADHSPDGLAEQGLPGNRRDRLVPPTR